jgi:hypothetical protein
MGTTPTTQADRVARSLKRLGFRMTRAGRSFSIIDTTGELAIRSKPGMTLAEIERWIGEFIKPKKTDHPHQLPALREALQQERGVKFLNRGGWRRK